MKEASARKTVAIYNMVPNLFWSALLLIPVSVFCYSLMDRKTFWFFFAVSMLVVFLPRSFFDAIQISSSASLYRKLGVTIVNRFTQNGDMVNYFMRKKYPGYKVISRHGLSLKAMLSQTYLFEKFHFLLFAFFALITVYAFRKGHSAWGVVFIISNIAYNVYPALLQQYIRIRLKAALQRSETK